jgi:hypothetical protein
VRPADHPEFFRFPAPTGLSRESKIRLDRHGDFFHEGEKIERPAMVKALHAWLSQHPDDGRPILENGYDWCYLEVEDTAHFVAGLRGAPPAAPVVVLASGHEEPLDAASLSVDAEGVCRVNVTPRGARRPVPARFLPRAQSELAPWLLDEPLRVRTSQGEFEIRTPT